MNPLPDSVARVRTIPEDFLEIFERATLPVALMLLGLIVFPA